MKKFLLKILAFCGIPLVLLGIVYLVVDPFKTLRPFDLDYFDATNRDYLSTELFLRNYPTQQYDSYIFGSSRACGINSYHWKKYLPEGSKQYVFQSWKETLTGIEQKIAYMDEHNMPIKNALILFDIPWTFCDDQLPTEALTIKDYHFSGQSKSLFHLRLFYNYAQKPTFWIQSITSWMKKEKPEIRFDTISNDWDRGNRSQNYQVPPPIDSLCNCSIESKNAFLLQFSNSHEQLESEKLINDEFEARLKHIADVLKKHRTNYQIIITPGPCYTTKAINRADLEKLQIVFGQTYVHDYSGINEHTQDCYRFSDPNHFGMYVGWRMIEDIYHFGSN